ncbi:HNH endonuclease signature motif containing protein [Paenibacillus sp. FSL R5-0475]|uniref:HNH endonuclease n=1 Tax=Paenibacillus sp. FSL R5-0475 TaxID=2921643 RepID=UPI0030FB286E
MVKYGKGLNLEIVDAVNRGEIPEIFNTSNIREFIEKKGWEPSDNYINATLPNAATDSHSPTIKNYFVSKNNGYYELLDHYKRPKSIGELTIGKIIDNTTLCNIFKCSPQGGMRRSLKTNSLVLVSDHTTGTYDDFWDGPVLNYTGMGLIGDQDINFMQNKTLNISRGTNVELHLFEVYIEKQYIYRGRVKLNSDPFEDYQYDQEDNYRKVWIFPLSLLENSEFKFDEGIIEQNQLEKEKRVRKLTDEQLWLRAKKDKSKNRTVTSESTVYYRDPLVSELAKRLANGVCQLCESNGPFKDKTGRYFLETHHIDWLARGGLDSIENTVGLCPNCHRKMHLVDDKRDVQILKRKAVGQKSTS